MSTKADLKARAKFEGEFEKAISPILPIVKFKDEEPVHDFSSTLYTVEMNQKPFRTKVFGYSGMDHVSNLSCYVFISTGINPHGIDSTGRKGRTWTINFFLKGDVRPYKCKNTESGVILRKFYQYAESIEDVINLFIDYLNSESGKYIKALIKEV